MSIFLSCFSAQILLVVLLMVIPAAIKYFKVLILYIKHNHKKMSKKKRIRLMSNNISNKVLKGVFSIKVLIRNKIQKRKVYIEENGRSFEGGNLMTAEYVSSMEEVFVEKNFDLGEDRATITHNFNVASDLYEECFRLTNENVEDIMDGMVVDQSSVVYNIQNLVFAKKYRDKFKCDLDIVNNN